MLTIYICYPKSVRKKNSKCIRSDNSIALYLINEELIPEHLSNEE